MIKSDLIKKLAEDNPHLYYRDVEKIVGTIFYEIIIALENGNRVELRGFGAFSTKDRKARTARNPKTGSDVDVNQKMCELDLSQNTLAFTYCQVLIIYELKDVEQNISILYDDNEIGIIRGDSLSKEISAEIFARSGKIKEIKVNLKNSYFLF